MEWKKASVRECSAQGSKALNPVSPFETVFVASKADFFRVDLFVNARGGSLCKSYFALSSDNLSFVIISEKAERHRIFTTDHEYSLQF